MAEEAYRTLKWKILSTELAPGAFLNEQELAAATGFGRTPVHQALHRLQLDGLVEIRPRKGVLVQAWSPERIRQLVEARKPLEAAIARHAAERATQPELDALRKLLAPGRKLIAKGDRDGLLRLDHDFHAGLAAASRNPVLVELSASLHQRSALLWFVPLAGRNEYQVVQVQHEAILAALQARDGAAAAAAMDAHLDGFVSP
jgi:DNA-binding GntR family transcriptional regulator